MNLILRNRNLLTYLLIVLLIQGAVLIVSLKLIKNWNITRIHKTAEENAYPGLESSGSTPPEIQTSVESNDSQIKTLRNSLIAVLAVGTVLIIIVFIFYYNRICKPSMELANKVKGLIGDKSASPPDGKTGSEFYELAGALDSLKNYMNEYDIKLDDMEKTLNESKRLATLGELSAGVAHELNTPLTGIIVYSHLLKENTPKDNPAYANIEKIIREASRCKNIIKSLLEFSRQSTPALEKVDVNKIITEATNNIRSEPVFQNIRVHTEYGENLPVLMADASQIQEVFENIIHNAAEVMDGSGDLDIKSKFLHDESGKDIIEIHFADTGPGISPENIEHIFNPFFTTKNGGHGTGLGLAVSYGIVERHEGTIHVENREGKGAVFIVRLPVKKLVV